MAVYRIPLSPNPQRFSIKLGGLEYGITLRFRNYLERMTVTEIPQLAPGFYPQYTTDDLVGFSRNSIATYTDASGKIIVVEPEIPRFTPSGLLVEAEGRNVFPWSEDFNATMWLKTQTGTSAPPSVSPNAAVSPRGTMTADRVEFGFVSASNDSSILRCIFSGASIVGIPAAQSVWMQSAYGGTFDLIYRFTNNTAPTGTSARVTITPDWRQYKNYLAAPVATNIGMHIAATYATSAGTGPAVNIWGAHRQNGVTEVGTYIPTEGSAITRPPEIASIGHSELANTQGGWVIDISDRAGVRLVNGIPLVTGCDLLAQHKHLGFAGELRVQTNDDPDAPPTFINLGEQSHLYWIAA